MGLINIVLQSIWCLCTLPVPSPPARDPFTFFPPIPVTLPSPTDAAKLTAGLFWRCMAQETLRVGLP